MTLALAVVELDVDRVERIEGLPLPEVDTLFVPVVECVPVTLELALREARLVVLPLPERVPSAEKEGLTVPRAEMRADAVLDTVAVLLLLPLELLLTDTDAVCDRVNLLLVVIVEDPVDVRVDEPVNVDERVAV